jgi:hypothetical protein
MAGNEKRKTECDGSSTDLLLNLTRGGRRQRQQAREELESASNPGASDADLRPRSPELDSEFCSLLAKRWAWGEISATKLQEFAMAAYNDEQSLIHKLGTSSPGPAGSKSLKAFASLGNYGHSPGNCFRDLRAFLGEPCTPAPSSCPLPTKVFKPRRSVLGPRPNETTVEHDMLLPHVWFSYLYHHRRRKFNKLFLGNQNQEHLVSWWNECIARRDPRLIKHPMATHSAWKQNTIPIVLHGDAVPVIKI